MIFILTLKRNVTVKVASLAETLALFIIIITVHKIKCVVFILPRKRPAIFTTSTGGAGRGWAAMVFCGAGRGGAAIVFSARGGAPP